MDFDELDLLRRGDPAWRLLRADNAPLVLSVLGKVFVEDNIRSIAATELISRLDDELYALNERLGASTFPKPAKVYLDDWAAPANGWLRKYYPPGSDEAHFDATAAVEKALSWVASLRRRSFVGTESRLNTVFELLRQMAYGAETDPDVRLADLHRRRAELDAEITRVEAGDFAVLDASAQRDRYQQFAATARELLADFREVEANFRALDRALRARIAAWEGSKGELLDEVVGNRNTIADSDQGRSFQAFYDFLLSHERQAELNELLENVQSLEVIGETDPRMRHIHYDWLDAAERTQATVRLLSEQLRRFLDDQVWLENRRVMDILRGIESVALKLREHRDPPIVRELDATAPAVVLPMERPLYAAKDKVPIDSADIVAARDDVDASALFEQVYVDREQLSRAVRRELRGRGQVGLADVLARHPLELGLAELVGYLCLDDPAFTLVFDEAAREQVRWTDPTGVRRVATIPRVTFRATPPPAPISGSTRTVGAGP
jgi:flagellar motility protein MotE (MotC chaperone)